MSVVNVHARAPAIRTVDTGIGSAYGYDIMDPHSPRLRRTGRRRTEIAWDDGATNLLFGFRMACNAWCNVSGVNDANGPSVPTSGIGNRHIFQGLEYSWATGLHKFRGRWRSLAEVSSEGGCDPQTGRWLSNDPIGISGGLNQYVAFGNPVVLGSVI